MAGKTRDKLIQQAEYQFAQKGFYGTSIQDVATELGISKQGLLHHFPSKEKLYAAVLQQAADYLMATLEEKLEGIDDPTEQLLAAFTGTSMADEKQLRVCRLLVREILDNRERAERSHSWFLRPYLSRLEGIVLAGQASGAFAPVHAMAFVYQLIGATQYFLISQPTLQQLETGRAYREHVDNHEREIRRIIEQVLVSAPA